MNDWTEGGDEEVQFWSQRFRVAIRNNGQFRRKAAAKVNWEGFTSLCKFARDNPQIALGHPDTSISIVMLTLHRLNDRLQEEMVWLEACSVLDPLPIRERTKLNVVLTSKHC